jgi:hypothetical protein
MCQDTQSSTTNEIERNHIAEMLINCPYYEKHSVSTI